MSKFYINYQLKSLRFSSHIYNLQASVYVIWRNDLVSLFICTYCLISCSLSLADGAVHWQIKYCNGTAKTRTINWRARGILAGLPNILTLPRALLPRWLCGMVASFAVTPSPTAFLSWVIKETCRHKKSFSSVHRPCSVFFRTTNQ